MLIKVSPKPPPKSGLFSWGCRMHQLHFCRDKCPGYDVKQSDSETLVMLELWRMLSTLLLPSLPGPLWLGVVAPDRVLSMS